MASPPFEGEALFFTGGLHAAFLAALHRSDWVVGPYTEMAALTLRRDGARPRWRRTSLGIAARAALPAGSDAGPPASIKWATQGRTRELYWEERGLRVHAEIGRGGCHGRIPRRWLEPAVDGEAPAGSVTGRLIPVRLTMESLADDPLAAMAGPHRGILFASTCRPPSRLTARARQLLAPRPEASPEAV